MKKGVIMTMFVEGKSLKDANEQADRYESLLRKLFYAVPNREVALHKGNLADTLSDKIYIVHWHVVMHDFS